MSNASYDIRNQPPLGNMGRSLTQNAPNPPSRNITNQILRITDLIQTLQKQVAELDVATVLVRDVSTQAMEPIDKLETNNPNLLASTDKIIKNLEQLSDYLAWIRNGFII